MTKTYGLKVLRELILTPFTRKKPPLVATFDPITHYCDEYLYRYVIDQRGLWLQVNDAYGVGGELSEHEMLLTGFSSLDDELAHIHIEGAGYCYGLPGERPILPIPFTASELLNFNQITTEISNQVPNEREAAKWIAELEEKGSPEAVELARFILEGKSPPEDEPETPITVAPDLSIAQQDAVCLPKQVATRGAQALQLTVANAPPAPTQEQVDVPQLSPPHSTLQTLKIGAVNFPMKKRAMISKYFHQWPSIEADMADSSRNGLSKAKAASRGWIEDTAVEWAKAKGKWRPTHTNSERSQPTFPSISQLQNIPTRVHKL